ncbi:hypothetical protein B0A48_17173 [Cryoendolithus antarcticus]|uniref:SET domain-containing protein n=1 Tax=Cryoendolithus antarcticus TaxID=1507870 RepID=A0A1V8SCF5_9PEZI|nr:hypothetical protein B0A48_17173 [Cryoendolithus antarcticus]
MAKKAKKPNPDRDPKAGVVQKAVKQTALGTKFFEVQYAGAKGLGAFALQNISASTCILREDPILLIRKDEDLVSERDILAAYKKLSPEKKNEFDTLRDDGQRAPDASDPHELASSATTDRGLESLTERVWEQYNSNRHSVSDSRTGINGAGVYHLSSMFNHSCRPNATMNYDDSGTRYFYVIENIVAGQEITFAYNSRTYYMSTEHRSEDLDMDCLCDLCTSPVALREVSDTRRFMLRALYDFIHREDPAGEMPNLLKGMWMHQSTIDGLARLRPQEFPQWTTVHFFVIAKLLEVEGIITDTTITSYARAAVNVVHIADNAGRKVLPPREFENVKLWTQKSEKMARKIGYMDYEGDDRMRRLWYAMREVLLAVGPNGEIPELEKVASHAGGMRGLKRGKDIKGTLRPMDHLKKAGNGGLIDG